jgi:aldehyde:ferredoxin oxidoreductase
VLHLERSLLVRNYHRERKDDECVIPYFERRENLVNPFVGERVELDGGAFRRLLSDLYAARGWDVNSGRPTAETLRAFNLSFAAQQLAEMGLLS